EERLILSTCNRVEVYGRAADFEAGVEGVRRFLSEYHSFPLKQLDGHLYALPDGEAVRHLFRVASSLDSMVVGEPQILGQVKEAYRVARKEGHTGPLLNQLFERAFAVAKQVRARTGIAERAVSVGYAAVELAKKIFGDLRGRAVLLVGAGEMSELAARHLVGQGAETVVVASRTLERARELADALGGRAVPFGNISLELAAADIVISSTGAPHYVLRKEMVQEALHLRRGTPMFLIDIAVPRDVAPEVNELDDVYLYDIDDLQGVVEANLEQRAQEAQEAEAIVEREAEAFLRWGQAQDEVVPTVVALRQKIETFRQRELQKTLRKLKELAPEEREAVEALSRALAAKFLHDPTVRLKHKAQGGGGYDYLRIARDLFDLDR
ncbi:MAG: glutamyl-tRNA reductase, partial [Nitrospinota bacterium]